jgi:cell division protein FtsI (penicillin-binding protein 3)
MALSTSTVFPRAQAAPRRPSALRVALREPSELALRRVWLVRVGLAVPLLAALLGFAVHQLGPASFPAPPTEPAVRGDIVASSGEVLATGPVEARSYPLGVAGPLVGFTGAVQPDGRYGLEGLEYTLDDVLAAGEDVRLTIDATYQAAAERHLAEAAEAYGAESGSAVVLEAGTGRILAAASYPAFDANDWSAAGRDQMRNRPFQETYEPGSVIKPLVVAGLLESGRLRPDEVVEAPMTLRVGEQTFRDVVYHDPQLTVADVLAYSSNSGAIHLGQRFTDAELHDWLMRFGIGQDLPVSGTYTSSGQLNPWYQWVPQDHASNTIGQNHSTTALQLAVAYSVFANDGLYVPPVLIEGAETPPPHRVLSPEVAATMRALLSHVTEASGLRNAKVNGVSMAAKTGTADVFDPELGRYVPGEYSLSVAGMVPAERPRVVVVVTLHKPQEGATSTVATGGLFKDIVTDVVASWGAAPRPEALAARP